MFSARHHIEVSWRGDELHSRVVHEHMLELDVRELASVQCAHNLPPQARCLKHVRLVDARDTRSRCLEGGTGDPLDLFVL